MKLGKIVEILNAQVIQLSSESVLDNEYQYVFAADLMSDALALVCTESNETILLTGLANRQTLRTAEMLDVNTIIFVRNKNLNNSDIDLELELEFNLLTTSFSMYEACGLMYEVGLRTATK